VVVVKPIVVDKRRATRAGRAVLRRRISPKHGRAIDLFDSLVYFARVFRIAGLTLEFPLVTLEETRRPGHGRRRRWRANGLSSSIKCSSRLARRYAAPADDRWQLLPGDLPSPFDGTVSAAGVRRIAQRITYCLLHQGAQVPSETRGFMRRSRRRRQRPSGVKTLRNGGEVSNSIDVSAPRRRKNGVRKCDGNGEVVAYDHRRNFVPTFSSLASPLACFAF
jgi:hypothetical protein